MDANYQCQGQTALQLAFEHEHMECVKLLKEHTAHKELVKKEEEVQPQKDDPEPVAADVSFDPEEKKQVEETKIVERSDSGSENLEDILNACDTSDEEEA